MCFCGAITLKSEAGREHVAAAGVGEDGYYSAAEEDMSFTSSPGRDDSEKLIEMTHNPLADSSAHQVHLLAHMCTQGCIRPAT